MHTITAPQRSDRRDLDFFDSLQHHSLQNRTARTSLLDRIALRIALALVLWSTRPPRRSVSAQQRRAALDRERRERQWQSRWHSLPHI